MLKILSILAFIGTLVMFSSFLLGSVLVDFGRVGQDNFELYLIPAGYAFAIWPIIYLLFVAFGWWQLQNRNKEAVKKLAVPTLLVTLSHPYYFFATGIENETQVLISFIIMWSSLLWLSIRLLQVSKGFSIPSWQTTVPVSLHFGWITAAFPTAITEFLLKDLPQIFIPEQDFTIALALVVLFALIVIGLMQKRYITNWFLIAFGWGIFAALVRILSVYELSLLPFLIIAVLLVITVIAYVKQLPFTYDQTRHEA